MMNYATGVSNLRQLLPETLWLDPEHYEQARKMGVSPGVERSANHPHHESKQWQTYLNTLGMLTFEAWLKERLPVHFSVHQVSHEFSHACYLTAGEFKLCLIAAEHMLDEIIRIPTDAIEQSEFVAHFYVILEVFEEPGQVVIKGFLQYEELVTQAQHLSPQPDEFCLLPLSALDPEINHLIVFVQYLEPSPLVVPTVLTQPAEVPSQQTPSAFRTQLSQWLQGIVDKGWQTIDKLFNPEANLAWSTRSTFSGIRGGKLINCSQGPGEQAVVLLVTVTPEVEEKIGINIQVLPAAGAEFLPPQLKLALLSDADQVLQEVQSRVQDNYIQLKPFRGRSGTNFSIEVSFNHVCVRENFEL